MNTPMYMKTNDMAKLIGYSRDFLLDNREVIFFEKIHYFPKKNRINWKVSVMLEWVEADDGLSDQAKVILDLVS